MKSDEFLVDISKSNLCHFLFGSSLSLWFLFDVIALEKAKHIFKCLPIDGELNQLQWATFQDLPPETYSNAPYLLLTINWLLGELIHL